MDKYVRIAPIGHSLLTVADSLVGSGDLIALNTLGDIVSKLIVTADIVDEEVSLTEIGEIIGEALDLLRRGKSADEVKSSSIRRLLDE